jgi:hypothetical protein
VSQRFSRERLSLHKVPINSNISGELRHRHDAIDVIGNSGLRSADRSRQQPTRQLAAKVPYKRRPADLGIHAYIHKDKGQGDAGRSTVEDKDKGPQRRDTADRFYATNLTSLER